MLPVIVPGGGAQETTVPGWLTNPADLPMYKGLLQMDMLKDCKTDEEKQAILNVAKATPEFMQLIEMQSKDESIKLNTTSQSHINMQASKNICLSYLAGACKFGHSCRQNHPENPEEIGKWRLFFARHPCKWGMNCRMRDRCLYTHPDQAMAALAQQQAKVQAMEQAQYTVQNTEVGPVKFFNN